MTQPNNPDLEDTGLTEDDYATFFQFSWKQHLLTFVAIFVIVYGMFYWFSSSMKSNAEKKVQQAQTVLDRAENLSDEPTPRTLELEQMARRTDDERNRIVRGLAGDSFAKNFEGRLRNRFLQQTTFLELPDDWRNRLPSELQKWAETRRRERTQEIKQFLTELSGILGNLRQRINRADTIQKNKNLKEANLGGNLSRYKTARDQLLGEMEDVENQLRETSVSSPEIPDSLYRDIIDLVDPLTTMAMHFRNLSAFSSAPAAYYHSYRLLHDALRMDPENPAAHYQLGRLYRRLKLHDLAGEQWGRALRYDPNFKREQIIGNLEKRQEQNPRNPRANYYLAFALHEAGELERAEKYLKKVLEREQNRNSMVKVLAEKRLDYVRNGEPTYSKLTLF